MAFSIIEIASGCSDFCSNAFVIANMSTSLNAKISVTLGFPSVIVPVLSKTTVFIKCVFSKTSASFTNNPFLAATPVDTIIATGVASPSAQGQAITSTETPILNASSNGSFRIRNVIKLINAIVITVGTKNNEILSANFEIGAFELAASSTNFIIVLIVVSSPTFVASIITYPFVKIVELITFSPFSL